MIALTELYFTETPLIDATLPGTPIPAGFGVDKALENKLADLDYSSLTAAGSCSSVLDRNAFAIPKLIYNYENSFLKPKKIVQI